jgi:hypothetical protein
MGLTPFPSQQATIARSPLLPTAYRFYFLAVTFSTKFRQDNQTHFQNANINKPEPALY